MSQNANYERGYSGCASWCPQTYGYVNGNRYVPTNNNAALSLSPFTPTVSQDFDSSNRLTVSPDNAAYDPSGNQTAMGGTTNGYIYAYDAENRITNVTSGGATNPVATNGYVYDGEGQRVMKVTCAAGTNPCTPAVGTGWTIYVYDAFGNLAQEYGLPTGPSSMCGTSTCFVSVDQVGSTRLVTDSNGNPMRRYDYLPFGEELFGTGGRTQTGYQSAADGLSPKFTGQQRDAESLLDYFHARYYSPAESRFMSADPGNAGADATNSQTWNGYSYVGNNPLSYTDPSGQCWWCILVGGILDVIGAATLDPGLFAAGTAVEGISTAATIAGNVLLTVGTGAVAYGAYDSLTGGSKGNPGALDGSPDSSLGVPGTTDNAGNSFLGLSCLDSATQDLLEKALIEAASAALGVKVSRGQGPLIVQGGAMNVPLNVPAGVSPEVIANAGFTSPIFEPDFNREIRMNKRVPGPGKSVHVMFNTGGPGQPAITTARVHADIGNPEDAVGALRHLFGDVLAATMASRRHGVCAVKFN